MTGTVSVSLHSMTSVFTLASLCLVVGCGGTTSDMGTVKGVVTYNGKPVPAGTITFQPVSGDRPSTGRIESDGTYRLSSLVPGDGARLGEHKVFIEAKTVTDLGTKAKSMADEAKLDGSLSKPPTVTWHVPEKYASADTSGLTANVDKGTNTIDFNIE